MFNGCSSVTTLDVSGFDTSSVTDMRSMFYGCSSVTTLDVSGFDMTSVADVENMFLNTDMNESGTTTNYDNLLVAWEAQDLVDDLDFHGGDAQYSSTGETAKNAIIADDNWTFTDGGLAS